MPKRSKHDRAVRGYTEYNKWRKVAEFLDTKPEIPEVLRWLQLEQLTYGSWGDAQKGRNQDAVELLIKDRYPAFAVMERLRGKEKDG